MADDKDISETIEEEAALLEAADTETVEVEDEAVVDKTEDEVEAVVAKTEDEVVAVEEVEIAVSNAPEHWEESIRQAFDKADPETQEVWLGQQKEFQRGFNTVSQEAAQLRRYQQEHIGVQGVLDQVIPSWQAQGMSPEQGLGQLVQLGMAYASNPQQTILHLAEMAGLDLNTLGQDAPYRTSDDRARDSRMQSLEQRLNQQDRNAQTGRQTQLESEIAAFQADTDAEGNLANPYFEESMDAISALFKNGFTGDLKTAYEQVIWTNPETRTKLMASVPTKQVVKTDQQRTDAAKLAQKATSQRVKQARPAPNLNTEMDDLTQDELVARIAAQMEANG